MRKRMKKKALQKTIQDLFGDVPSIEEISIPKKSSTEEDMTLLLRAMHYEFDDAPSRIDLAKATLPHYAWWFILETYFEKEAIPFTRKQTKSTVTYQFQGGFVSVNESGCFDSVISGSHARPIQLLMKQKGYKQIRKR